MKERLSIPKSFEGEVWSYGPRDSLLEYAHRHTPLEANLVRAGKCDYIVAEQRVQLRCGSLLWIFPKQEHVILNKSADFAMWVVVANQKLVQNLAQVSGLGRMAGSWPQGDSHHRLPPAGFSELLDICSTIQRQRFDAQAFNLTLRYLVMRMRQVFEEYPSPESGTRLHPAVARAAQWLSHPNGREFSGEELARRSGLSRSRLSRLFIEQTGKSLATFRNEQRLEYYKYLLKQKEGMTLTEAAYAAGFGSYAQFHRIHLALEGMSPRVASRAENNRFVQE